MHSLLRPCVFPFLLACATAPEVPEPAAAPSPGWAERFATVRADLDLLATAHQAKDREACLNHWEVAYREHFEPLIEVPLRGRLQGGALIAVEYDFGRLYDAIGVPRPGPTESALAALRQALAELEQQAVSLPAPE
jgi:hypothetical protein